MNQWYDFYVKRVNSSYQDYFNKRYEPMISFIESFKPSSILEIGCGIGSISKALSKPGINLSGFDLCPKMVELANQNIGKDVFFQGNALDLKSSKLSISHGVLEHFSDEHIIKICNNFPNSIHYVPLDKYEKPSFGDERLLSSDYWLNLVIPQIAIIFNNDHDLIFKI